MHNEADIGPHGIPLAVATDPANQWGFSVGLPVTDWAAHALAEEQKKFYDQYPDAQKAGHLWSVHLDNKPK